MGPGINIGIMFTVTLFLTFVIFWIVTLVRIIKYEFPGQNEKLIRALLGIFLPFIGTIIYFVAGRPGEIRN